MNVKGYFYWSLIEIRVLRGSTPGFLRRGIVIAMQAISLFWAVIFVILNPLIMDLG
jgi:hypothetical protein